MPDLPESRESLVLAALRAVVPASIAVAGGPIAAAASSPFAEEHAAVARAVDKRRHEFFAGRTYARRALAQLGIGPVALPASPSRAPRWPAGMVGSVSHAGDLCVAIAARGSDFAGVGVDIELDAALEPDLHATIGRPDELAAIPPSGVDPAKWLFVAKEAFFKLWHPLTGEFIDFHAAHVRVDPRRGEFSLTLRDHVPALHGRRTFAGVCGHAGGHCFAFVALGRAPRGAPE